MMSEARFSQIISGQTAIAQKVYEHVPLQEHWSVKEVYAAASKSGMVIDAGVLHGCLRALTDCGLLRENRLGFKREGVRKKVELSNLKEAIQAQPQTQETKPMPKPQDTGASAVDTLGNLAQRLAALAQRHQQEMKELADLVSDAAIEVQAQFERHEADVADLGKLRQLKDLLKTI
jgi:uncharacterized membrane protein YccC